MKRSPFFCDIAATGPVWAGIQGWEVANCFTTTAEEHLGVRERVGFFDWSSTGEIVVQGRDALPLVQRVIVNDASKMPVNRVLYTSILDGNGAITSDITVYRLAEETYLLMTAWGSNAAGDRPEYELLVKQGQGMNAAVVDLSSGWALPALQGPRSRQLLGELTDADLGQLSYMWGMPARVAGFRAYISRTGYTGELGYEIIIPAEHAHDFWMAVLEAGEKHGLVLCGMATAFGLRMEKGYIMRHDFAGGRTPYEIGLGWTVKLDKGDFIGRDALIRRNEAGYRHKLVLMTLEDDHVPANGAAILKDGQSLGAVTSAAYGYAVGKPLALGFVPIGDAEIGTKLSIQDGAGEWHPAVIVPRPLYDPEGKRLRS